MPAKEFKNLRIFEFLFSGISYVQKKLVRYAKPKLKLSVDGDVITIEVHAVVVHTRTEIKLDEEYTNTYLGTKVKVGLARP